MANEISDAEMDKYFQSGGKEAPAAIVEAQKVEAEAPPEQPIEPVEAPKVDAQVEPKEVAQVEPKETPGAVKVVTEDGKTVPLSELMEERKSRQAYQNLAATQQEQLTEMLKMVKSRVSPEVQETAPDPNSDPFGYLTWGFNTLSKQTAEINQWRTEQSQAQQQREGFQRVGMWAQAKEAEFKAATPDYQNAYNFAAEQRHKELEALGYTDPVARQQIITNDINTIVMNAAQTNQNPAALVYNYAKAKGYKAEIVAAEKKVPDLDDKVKTVRKGLEASTSLSKSGGGAPTEINNLQDLLGASEEMDDDEFNKAFDKIIPRMKGKFV